MRIEKDAGSGQERTIKRRKEGKKEVRNEGGKEGRKEGHSIRRACTIVEDGLISDIVVLIRGSKRACRYRLKSGEAGDKLQKET